MLTSFLLTSVFLFAYLTSIQAAEKPSCTNKKYDFAKSQSIEDWVLVSGSENHGFSSEGLAMKLMRPKGKVSRKTYTEEGTNEKLAYNSAIGDGFTFNATTWMQYGKLSATIKSAGVPGAVTAVILYADNGDEIDFEFLAGPNEQVTTNYFYGPHIVYGENGKTTNPPGGNAYDDFYTYTIEWSPEKIVWSINGDPIRTLNKSSTKKNAKHGNVHEYPTNPARVSIGLWDGSSAGGTARWARGPIDWNQHPEPITAYVKAVEIVCDPQHNTISK